MTNSSQQQNKAPDNFFEAVLRSAGYAIIASDLDGIIQSFNHAAEKMLGYQGEEVIGKIHAADLYKQAELETRAAELSAKLDRPITHEVATIGKLIFFPQESHEEKWTYIHKDGHEVRVSVAVSKVRNQEGETSGYLGVIKDVTQEEKDAIALQLRTKAMDESINPIVISDIRQPDAPIIYVNQAFEQQTGYPAKDVLGKNCRFLQGDDKSQPEIETIRQAIKAGKKCAVTLRNYRKDGTPYWNSLKLSPIHNDQGELTHFVGIQDDVTQTKELEQEALAGRQRLATILESVSLPLVITRIADGIVLYANDPAADLFKIPLEEILNQQAPDFYKDPAERQVLLQAIRSEGHLTNYEIELKDIHGALLWTLLSMRPIIFEGHHSLITTFLNVTDRKNAEEELQLSREDLQTQLEASPEAIGLLNTRTGFFENPNTNAEKLYGLSREKLLAVGLAQTSPEYQPNGRLSAEMAGEKVGEALQGGNPVFEWTHTNSVGDEIPCEIRLVSLGGDRKHLIRFSVTDISERKRSTEALAKRAAELETVAEVSTAISAIQDSDEMLQTVVDLTKHRFALYHAHIFLLDQTSNMLILRKGADEVGRAMVAEGRQIPLASESSLVATAARTRHVQIRDYTGEMEGFMPHPALIDTRAEMALPLTVGSTILGVLDIRSDQQEAFDEAEKQVFTALAAQVAISLKNASSLSELLIASDQLRASQQQLEAVLENLPVGVVVVNKDKTEPQIINKEAIRFLGGSNPITEENEMYLHGRGEKYPMDTFPLNQAQQTGLIKQDRVDIVQATGRTTAEVIAVPIKNEAGQTRQVIGLFEDITEKVQTQDGLQSILKSVTLPMVITRARDNKLTYANEPLADLFKLSLDDIIGRTAPDFYYDINDRAPYLAQMRQNRFVDKYEVDLKKGDGSRFYALMSAQYLVYHGDPSYITTIVDITDRDATEKALAKRANALATVSEISATISTILDLDEMLEQVVNLTKERFDLFHVQILLLNDERNMLTLVAGAGEIGREMLAAGWKIKSNRPKSLVAQAIKTKQAQIRTFTDRSGMGRPHPLMEQSHSGMTIPLVVGDGVLGVMGIRALEPDAFDEIDNQSLSALAAQVAIAIRNAQSLASSESSRNELDMLTRRLTREGWQEFMETEADHRYSYDLNTTQSQGENLSAAEEIVPHIVSQSLDIQGASIGKLQLVDPQNYGDDTAEIFSAVAERLGAHIENLRLTEQTYAALSDSDVLYQVTTKLNEAETYEEILDAIVDQAPIARSADRISINYFNQAWPPSGEVPDWADTIAVWPAQYRSNPLPRFHPKSYPKIISLMSSGDPLIIEDITTDPRIDDEYREFSTRLFKTKSTATFLLSHVGQWVGYITLIYYNEPYSFSPTDVERFKTLVQQISISAQAIRLGQEREQALAATEALYRGSEQIVRAQSYMAVLRALIDALIVVKKRFDHADILLFDRTWTETDKASEMHVVADWNRQNDKILYAPRSIPLNMFNGEQPFEKDQPTIIPDILTDPRLTPELSQWVHTGLKTKGLMLLPLISAGDWFGMISIQTRQELPKLADDELRLIANMVDQAATVLQSIRLLQEAQTRAEREAKVREISNKVRRGTDRHEILDIARLEIAQLLRASKSQSHLGTQQQLSEKIAQAKKNGQSDKHQSQVES